MGSEHTDMFSQEINLHNVVLICLGRHCTRKLPLQYWPTEESEKQQKHLLNLISGNLEITMKGIKSIKTEMNDLKKSIELTEIVLKENVQKSQEKAEHLYERIRETYDWQIYPEYFHNKLLYLEDRSRRNNFRIYGI